MFGIKIEKFTTKEEMSIEELYEKIKDIDFMAGKPELTKHGLYYLIAFPPEDRENQVWILKTKKGFTIQRSVIIAGVSNMIVNSVKAEVLDQLTDGIAGAISQFGGPKKACVKHVDDAAAKIRALDL